MDRVQTIIDMIKSGMSAKEIAEQAECHAQNVYGVARRYGLKVTTQADGRKKRDAEIIRLREAGCNYKQICDAIGADKHTVSKACKRLGCELTDAVRQKIVADRVRRYSKAGAKATKEKWTCTEAQVAEKIREADRGIEYVGGYTNNKGTVTVKCVECGGVFEVTYQTATSPRNEGAVHCPRCQEIKQAQEEAEKKERQRQREQKREEAQAEKERKRQERMHACPVCGKITDRQKYCSKQCCKRANNKIKEIRRRMKCKGGDNITLEALVRRDGYVCYICGLAVNDKDYIERDGTIIAGNYYPSIDHVKPISYGGKHVWSNVRLAHRICNTIKGNRMDFVS